MVATHKVFDFGGALERRGEQTRKGETLSVIQHSTTIKKNSIQLTWAVLADPPAVPAAAFGPRFVEQLAERPGSGACAVASPRRPLSWPRRGARTSTHLSLNGQARGVVGLSRTFAAARRASEDVRGCTTLAEGAVGTALRALRGVAVF